MTATSRRWAFACLSLLLPLLPAMLSAQKALVYCPAVDPAGCGTIAGALGTASALYPGGVDRGYDGSGGTIDLTTADLSGYAVLVVPSLADDGAAQPYAMLRDPAVAARLRAVFGGRVAVWSGTPDLGTSNRDKKDALLRNLAGWARAGDQAPGVVALLDASEPPAQPYAWLSGISAMSVQANLAVGEIYANVEVRTSTGTQLLDFNGLQLGYTNMASGGLFPGADAVVEATGGRTMNAVLVTVAGAAAGEGIATITTDKEDYAPGETVTITGTGWEPGETVSMRLHEEPTVHGDRNLSATADSLGHIVNRSFTLEEHDLGVRFVLTGTGQSSGRTAQTTFTDGRVVLSATLNGGTAVNVSPSAVISAKVSVQITAAGNIDWGSTRWTIGASTACVNHANHTGANNTFDETFNVAAPSSPGLYSATFEAFSNDNCGGTGGGNTPITLANAVTVQPANAAPVAADDADSTDEDTPVEILALANDTDDGPAGNLTITALTQPAAGTGTVTLAGDAKTVTYTPPANFHGTATFTYKAFDGTLASASAATVTVTVNPVNDPPTLAAIPNQQVKWGTLVSITLVGADIDLPAQSLTYSMTSGPPGAGVSGSTFSWTPLENQVGTATVTVAVSDGSHSASQSFDVEVQKHATAIAYTGWTSGTVFGPVTFAASLIDTDAGNAPLTGKTVAFALGAFGTSAVTQSVGAAGVATTAATIPSGTGATTVIATYTPAAGEGYLGSSVTTPFTLNKAAVTVTMADATVTYDGTPRPLTASVIDAASAPVASPPVTYAYTGTGGTIYNSSTPPENAGTYSVVATYAGNADYASGSATAALTIEPRALTITATGVDRPYDGTTNATVTLSDDRVAGDALTTAYATASFGDKHVGVNKPITVSGITLGGSDAPNYTFNTTASTSADITAIGVTVTATADDKEYDGTTTATFTLGALAGAIGGDDVAATGGTASFADKNVGVNKLVTVTGAALAGTDAGNYNLGGPITAQADITVRPLVVTATGVSRVYDATTGASVTFSHDGIGGDDLGFSYTASFADKHVASGKPITINTFALTGGDAGNYSAAPPAGATADITPAPLTVAITAADRTYDGTTAAEILTRTPQAVFAGDDVSVTGGTASFADKNVGTGKMVTATGLLTGGADAANYAFDGTSTTTASITARALAVTATGVDKVYDATTAATVTFTDDRVSGDVFTVSGTASFGDKNVGAGKPVSVSGIQLVGTDAGNYAPNTTAAATASITPATLTATITAEDKIYDGTTDATIASRTPVGVLGTDDIALSGGVAAFADKHAGNGKTVTATGILLGGADAGNYAFDGEASATANITPRDLAVTATGIDRIYDGTTVATVTFADDRLAGDVFTVTGTAAFADKNVGNDKLVTVTGIALAGTDGGNYAPNLTTSTTADITPRALLVSATGIDKEYDGTTAATVSLSDDRVAGDLLTVGYSTAEFTDKHAGIGKTINVLGITVGGTDAGNYEFNTTATAAATVTPKPLAVTAHGVDKVYDGTTAAAATFTDDRLTGDVFTIAYLAAFDTKDVGNDKPVSVTAISLAGADAGNYAPNTTAATVADITPRPITVAAEPQTKVYGDPDPELTYAITAGSLVAGEAFTGGLERAPGELIAGSPYAIGQGTLTAGTNYALTFQPAELDITPAPLTVVVDDKTKIQGGVNPTLTGSVTGQKLGDIITATYSTTAVELSPPGAYPITATLVDADGKLPNYTVTNTPGTLTVTPNAAPVLSALSGLTTAPLQLGTPVTVSATFSDADVPESTPYATYVDWGDGTAPVAATPAAPGSITDTHTYANPGVYVVTVGVKDKISGYVTQSFEYVVIYDPNGGFVTGGGWIMSPTGSYVPQPSLAGKATFGFVAKYKKGQQIPDGNTEFQFHAAGLNFKSSSYEWLVVAGSKAQYKGVGTLNGQPGYRFMLTAIDGSKGAADRFRMKITDAAGLLVYDNQIGLAENGDPATVLSGGSIVVHDK